MKESTFDVIVVGLGAVGSATLYQLSKRGINSLGIDQFDPPHTLGSSHGETRITRLAVGEGEEYVALAKRSHEIWAELEALSGKKIRTKTGGILLDSGLDPWSKHGVEGFWERTLRYAQNQKIAHQVLTHHEFQKKYPNLLLPPSGKIYWEEEAGYLFPEVAIQTQLDLAKKQGATVWTSSKADSIHSQGEYFQIRVEGKEILAKQVILSAGGWVKDFLSLPIKKRLSVCRQVLYWISIAEGCTDWQKYPVWMWGYGPAPEDFIYGFPSLDGKSIKMASESFVEVDHPDELNREVSEQEKEIFWVTKVDGKLRGLKKQILKTSVCFYTVTEDARFVIEPMNGDSNFLWVSACSGHGFKHSAALGEDLVKRLGY
ncbi:MAG: N-methyl-L-tryptophan oxidase [Bacteroidetes bacterium]|nr:N-methyl-L-tryptophan oxidase [Bacteroidota bacterium]